MFLLFGSGSDGVCCCVCAVVQEVYQLLDALQPPVGALPPSTPHSILSLDPSAAAPCRLNSALSAAAANSASTPAVAPPSLHANILNATAGHAAEAAAGGISCIDQGGCSRRAHAGGTVQGQPAAMQPVGIRDLEMGGETLNPRVAASLASITTLTRLVLVADTQQVGEVR